MGMPVLLVSKGTEGDWWRETVLTRSDVELTRHVDCDSAYEALLTGAWRIFLVEHERGDDAVGTFLWRVRVSPWTVPPRCVLITPSGDPDLRKPPVVRVVRSPPRAEDLDRALSPLLDLPVRECCRTSVSLPVTGTTPHGRIVQGVTSDLSTGGMLLETGQPVAMGERLAWAFDKRGPLEGLSLHGAALRHRPKENSSARRLVAVRFDATASAQREAIERFLRALPRSLGPKGRLSH